MKIIIHYNEIALKKGNRDYFEKKLINNIKERFNKEFPDKLEEIKRFPGRFLIKMESTTELQAISYTLQAIFGIANFSFVTEVEQNIDNFKESCWKLLKDDFSTKEGSAADGKTFRVATQRSNKNFPMTSEEINREVGGYIYDKLEKRGMKPKVDLKNPDKVCFIEIFNNKAFIFSEKINGLGGMPVGTSGKALALLSGGIDSPVAAYYGLKRGVSIDFIHFHSLPYTSPASNEKVKELAKKLLKFQLSAKVFMVPFADIQQEIVMKCPEKLRVVMYRRMMMKIAEGIASKKGHKALYTGESVAQVASQTLENIAATNDAIRDIPILRPLIGFDKSEIIEIAKKIDTYETSILPHDDCCTRFVPKHPETKADLDEVRKAEKNLDTKKLIDEATGTTEVEIIK